LRYLAIKTKPQSCIDFKQRHLFKFFVLSTTNIGYVTRVNVINRSLPIYRQLSFNHTHTAAQKSNSRRAVVVCSNHSRKKSSSKILIKSMSKRCCCVASSKQKKIQYLLFSLSMERVLLCGDNNWQLQLCATSEPIKKRLMMDVS
jgi:translation initiation factor 1 (eIF-1/SUI1)